MILYFKLIIIQDSVNTLAKRPSEVFQNKLILHYRLYSGIFIRNNKFHNFIESVNSYYPLLQYNNYANPFKKW